MTYTSVKYPTEITLNESSLSLITGSTSTLSVTYNPSDANKDTEITWETSNEAVATVAGGVVTAVGSGTATITATTANDVSTTCTVTVADATAPAYYSEIASGEDYYIVNAATGKFLGGANDWGTQASLIDHGIPFTLTKSGEIYTLDSHTFNNSSQHYLTGTYVDGNATNLYISLLGNGKYSISTTDGSAYLTATAGKTVVANTANSTSSTLAQWYFVSKADRDKLLASASTTNPVDATYYIQEANISRNLKSITNTEAWKNISTGGDQNNRNFVAQVYNATVDVSQVIENIPNGTYTLTMQGFTSGTDVKLKANETEVPVRANTFSVTSCSAASDLFASRSCPNTLDVTITDNTLTIALTGDCSSNKWLCYDNFELYYISPSLEVVAEALPDVDMTANKWYYFDIPIDGDYDLTLTTLDDIVYTTDGSILKENENSITTNFSSPNPISLENGRYFVKSSSAQKLTVTPHSYTYSVGDATLSVSDGGYTQSNTFTVTYPYATTNNPNVTTSFVASSKGTVNGNEVALSAVTNGFSIDLGSLTANTDYRIVIPASVYGYTGESMNDAIDITIHTPGVFDGFYFLRSSDGKYIARGADYNTRATVDEFGLPLMVTTDADGNTTFKYVDNNLYLFDAGNTNIYTDNTSYPNWKLQATEGGFYIVNANDNGSKDKTVGIVDGHLQSNGGNVVWNFEALSAHNTFMEALKDAQAATAAAASGNETITTKAGLTDWLDDNFTAVTVDVPEVPFTEKWHGDASAEWGAGKDMYTNTISSLPEGLYKLTVNAFYRLNGSATAADGARGNTYLYGGTAKTQLYSLKDFPAVQAWDGRNQSDADGYYPDDVTSGTAATANTYLTELYVYHTGGDFTYGIHQPSRFSNQQWFGYQNFTLTRYEIDLDENTAYTPVNAKGYVHLSRTIKAGYNTVCLPFSLTAEQVTAAFGTDAEVYEYSENSTDANSVTINFTKGDGSITANVPVLVKAIVASSAQVFKGVQVVAPTGDIKVGGTYLDYVGVYETTELAAGDFFIATKGGVQNVYQSQGLDGKKDTVKGFRAYFKNKNTSTNVKAFLYIEGDDATGIESLTPALSEGEEAIYNVAGQRMSKMQKGINIVNGKKVLF